MSAPEGRLVDAQSAPAFARELLEFARRNYEDLASASFGLHRLRLRVASSLPSYLEHCRRALVDGAGPDGVEVRVAVLDYENWPHMPRAKWQGHFNVVELGKSLEAAGLMGHYEFAADQWQIYDPEKRFGIAAPRALRLIPPWEQSFPARNFIHWGYLGVGLRLVHAGTLGQDGSGVLLIGDGGSGKSGTTLSGILAGLSSAGDDYVAIEIAEDMIAAYPVIRLMKQDAAGLDRLGIARGQVGSGTANWQGKFEFDYELLRKGRRADLLKLRAILLPRIFGAKISTFVPATAKTAMLSLAPNNLQQLPGAWLAGLAFTAALARRLPAYALDLSSDGDEIAAAISGFLENGGPP